MENNSEKKEKYLKLGFFKKVWYSIIKFEKYPEMAATGLKANLIYFIKLVIIFSLVFTIAYSYYIYKFADFGEQDLNYSQKIIMQITSDIYNTDEQAQMIELFSEIGSGAVITSLFMGVLISFLGITLIDAFTLSLFGLLTCFIAKLRIKYKAVFNMSIFALTLPVILRLVYSVIKIFTGYQIQYFSVMYTAISYISLAAAIFMIKSDIVKQNLELMKIIEENKEKIEQTIQIPKNPNEDEEEKKEDEPKKEEKKDGEDVQGQGSGA